MCLQRVERARHIRDTFESQAVRDSCAVRTLQYLKKVVEFFVQGLPFVKKDYPEHPLCTEHRILRHPKFASWERLQLQHARIKSELEHDMSLGQGFGSFQFFVDFTDDGAVISAHSENQNDSRFAGHVRNLTDFVNGVSRTYTPRMDELCSRMRRECSNRFPLLRRLLQRTRKRLVRLHK